MIQMSMSQGDIGERNLKGQALAHIKTNVGARKADAGRDSREGIAGKHNVIMGPCEPGRE